MEKQINDKDLYSKTERLYLNSHLIQRIKPLLYTMGERDKTINKLEIICCMNSNIGLLEIEDDKSKFTVIETEVKKKTRKY